MKPNNKPPQPGTGRIFDVARPGRSMASATSRPVIVGHKPQVKDPMMSGADDNNQNSGLMDSHDKKTLQPNNDAVENVNVNAAAVPEAPEVQTLPSQAELPVEPGLATQAKSIVEGAEEPTSQPQAEPSALANMTEDNTATPTPESWQTPEASISDLRQPSGIPEDQVSSSGQPSQQPIEMAQPPESSVRPIPGLQPEAPTPGEPTVPSEPTPPTSPVGGGQVVQPSVVVSHHHSGGKRAGKVIITILLILILAAVTLDVLLDAGFIVWDVPHTDFF